MGSVAFKTPDQLEEERKEREAERLRVKRNAKLKETDVDVLKFLEQGEAPPKELRDYRQELRDLPDKADFPDHVELPEKPHS